VDRSGVGVRRNGLQQVDDLRLGQRVTVDPIPTLRGDALGQELYGADAVPADGLQQIEDLARPEAEAPAQPRADPFVVRQEVVEVVADRRALELQRSADEQGERERSPAGRLQPGRVVARCASSGRRARCRPARRSSRR
jgi:hypothetical protein